MRYSWLQLTGSLLSLVCFVFLPTLGFQQCTDCAIPCRYQAFANAFDAERQQLNVSGAAIAIIENGHLAFAHGFGVKGPKSKDTVCASTLFRIGSMTKALTAAALMSLAGEGKIDPNALVISVIPDISLNPTYLPKLTLHEALTHTSGLYSLTEFQRNSTDAALSQTLTSPAFEQKCYFQDPPGTMWNYANPNFCIAGLAVERVSNSSYREVMKSRVFDPLGMTRTFFLPSEALADGDYSNGESVNSDGSLWDVAPDSYDSYQRPAGLAFSSVLDYAKFVQFLYAGNSQVMPEAKRQLMMQPYVSDLFVGSYELYAYGLWVSTEFQVGNNWYNANEIWHGGLVPGYTGFFVLIPSSGFGMITLANVGVPASPTFPNSFGLALQLFANLPAPSPFPASILPDVNLYTNYTGTYYETHYAYSVIIGLNGYHQLTISIPAYNVANIHYNTILVPQTLDNFILVVGESEMLGTFVRDGTGNFYWLRVTSASLVFARQPPAQANLEGLTDVSINQIVNPLLRLGLPRQPAMSFPF